MNIAVTAIVMCAVTWSIRLNILFYWSTDTLVSFSKLLSQFLLMFASLRFCNLCLPTTPVMCITCSRVDNVSNVCMVCRENDLSLEWFVARSFPLIWTVSAVGCGLWSLWSHNGMHIVILFCSSLVVLVFVSLPFIQFFMIQFVEDGE